MKRPLFVFTFLILAFAFLVGCGVLEKSNKQYSLTVDTLGQASQVVTFEVTTLDNTIPTGYALNIFTVGFPLVLKSTNFYSTNPDFTVPQITINRAHIDYRVTADSNNFLGAWEPTPKDIGLNIVVPRAPISAEATISMNSLTPYAHMKEVADKIVVVYATPDPQGKYVFTAAFLTDLMVRADIALSGADENGNAVATSFTTNIDYALTF